MLVSIARASNCYIIKVYVTNFRKAFMDPYFEKVEVIECKVCSEFVFERIPHNFKSCQTNKNKCWTELLANSLFTSRCYHIARSFQYGSYIEIVIQYVFYRFQNELGYLILESQTSCFGNWFNNVFINWNGLELKLSWFESLFMILFFQNWFLFKENDNNKHFNLMAHVRYTPLKL